MAPPSSTTARIVTRLLLGWVLLIVGGLATASGKAAPTAGHAAKPSVPVVVFAATGHTDRDDASCVKATPVTQTLESDVAKCETEPDLSLDGAPAQRPALAPWRPGNLRDASVVLRRNTPLGRGPPRLA
ncbi:hypothetical protein J2X02_000575 [Pseudoxanthomonas japonensis]|uniref:hypothetical protein n=1 Tax=Pseudoxanthomonas japonensis TaxID=69284 RepID=UPI002863543A|nr:hypothetical protein [Pseudoxanthomonas japonensis]MDR7067758.1 hypothetical protein [Pseudoxanthomonas japonensis]